MTVTVVSPLLGGTVSGSAGYPTFSAMRSAAGTTTNLDAETNQIAVASDVSEFTSLMRGATVFDLGSFTGQRITAVDVKLFVTGSSSGHGQQDIVTVSPTLNSHLNVVITDYAIKNWIVTELAPRLTFAVYSAAAPGFITVSLNTAGVSYLNTRIGTTAALGIILSDDFDDTGNDLTIGSKTSGISISTEDNSTPSERPTITLTHEAFTPVESGPNMSPGNQNDFIPRAVTMNYTGTGTPNGWALCDGSTVNGVQDIQFSSLFDVIGISNGGTGRDSFVLPTISGEIIKL